MKSEHRMMKRCYKDEDVGRGLCVVLEGKGKSERVLPTFLSWSSPFDLIVNSL